jgi:hypothetical protein
MGYKKPSYAITDVDNNFSTGQTINGTLDVTSTGLFDNNVTVSTSGSSGDLFTLESTAVSVDFRLNSDKLILKFDNTEILKISEFSTSGQASIENLSFVDFASKFQISTSSGTTLDNLTSFLNIRQRVNGGVFNLTGNTSGGTQHTGVQICSDATNVDVLLHYNGVEKLATKSDGIEVSGVVDLSSATNGFVLGDKASSNKILYASTENAFTLIKSDNTFAGVRASDLLLSPVTFANLPSGGALTTGLISVINDAGTVTYRGTASGGGSNVSMVMYDGTNWIYH